MSSHLVKKRVSGIRLTRNIGLLWYQPNFDGYKSLNNGLAYSDQGLRQC